MIETFDESLARFRDFLVTQGRPGKVVWLLPDDVLLTGSESVYVNLNSIENNETSARQLFERGLVQGYGVLFKALFSIENETYACVWVPKSAEEAQHALMPRGVKLSVPSGEYQLNGKVVKSLPKWLFLSVFFKGRQKLKSELFSR